MQRSFCNLPVKGSEFFPGASGLQSAAGGGLGQPEGGPPTKKQMLAAGRESI